MIDQSLWLACQQIVYGWSIATTNPPFAAELCSPKRKRASWLYQTLMADPVLRTVFFNTGIKR